MVMLFRLNNMFGSSRPLKHIRESAKADLRRVLFKNNPITMSQAGQDYWVYGEVFDQKKFGFFVDIGAHDGIIISNSYLLEKKYGWTGICIEANPVTFEKLKNNRSAKCLNICLDRSIGEVNFILRDVMGGIIAQDLDNQNSDKSTADKIKLKTMPLTSVLIEHHAPDVIDYLSIDVEGAEERILSDFDFGKYTFRCITIERPTELLRAILKNHGYILVKEIPMLDCFYIHQSFLEDYRDNLFRFYRKERKTIRWQ